MSPETASKERIGYRRLLLSKIAQYPPSLRATMKTCGDAAAKMKIFGESPFVTLVVGFAAGWLTGQVMTRHYELICCWCLCKFDQFTAVSHWPLSTADDICLGLLSFHLES